MNVAFYFDPSCPFSWITSRWLLQVSNKRNLQIDWRPFSLALKNDELSGNKKTKNHSKEHVQSHRMLRVMMAAHSKHDIPLIDSYSASGMIRHILGESLTDEAIATVLENMQLPQDLISYADDETLDVALQSYIADATRIVGDSIGVPTIVFTLKNGSQQGYFGPVLTELPSLEESLQLWDSISQLATAPMFFELKRDRGNTHPDTASTARC